MTTCPCGCQRPVLSARATYASARCRLRASQQRRAPIPATVRAVRILKDGTQQVILHVPQLWAVAAPRGADVSLIASSAEGQR